MAAALNREAEAATMVQELQVSESMSDNLVRQLCSLPHAVE